LNSLFFAWISSQNYSEEQFYYASETVKLLISLAQGIMVKHSLTSSFYLVANLIAGSLISFIHKNHGSASFGQSILPLLRSKSEYK